MNMNDEEIKAFVKREVATQTEQALKNHSHRLDAHGKEIRALKKTVSTQQITQIQADVAAGMKSKDVAAKHDVKPGFVSVVAPRYKFAPGPNNLQ